MADAVIDIEARANLDQASREISSFSKRAQLSLVSLSQVVQDLPYGFIGIQNNIPILAQNFGLLVKEQNGLIGAFKSLGSTLFSPTGAVFALSAVTATVDYLIQKYGSLGNAMNVIFAKSSEMAKAQQDYNKEIAKSIGGTQTEIVEINILTKTLANLDAPMKDRQAAYVELKKISPDIVAGVRDENDLTQKQIGIILANAEARKQNLLLKAQELAISSVLNKNAESMMKLEIEREQLISNLTTAEQKYANAKNISSSLARVAEQGISAESITLKNAKKALIDNINQYNNLIKVNDEYTSRLSPTISKIANYDLAIKDLNDSLKEQNKITELIDPVEKSGLVKGIDILKKDTKLKLFDNIIDGTKTVQNVLAAWQEQNQINKILKQFEQTAFILNEVFFNPLTDAFNTLLTTGKFSIQQFTKAVMTSISQLVSKIIATGIINLLFSLFTGGVGPGIKGFMGAVKSSFGGAFNQVLGGRVSNPSFAGVGGGAMGMTGSVNLTLRGSDLVGAINRTNSQISRVG